MSFFSVVLGYVWLVFGLLRHVVRLSMRFLFWLHQDLSDLCRTSNETYTIGFTRSQLLCLLRESCGRATWPQQQLWIFYFPGRGRERESRRDREGDRERERGWAVNRRKTCGFGGAVNNWKNHSPGGIYGSRGGEGGHQKEREEGRCLLRGQQFGWDAKGWKEREGWKEERVMGAIKGVARKFGVGGWEVWLEGVFAELKSGGGA